MKAPCLSCEKRGCGSYHDECQKYQEFVREFGKQREDIQTQHYFASQLRKMK